MSPFNNRGNSRDRGFQGGRGGRDFDGPKQMHKATCSSCGDNCQVPFRPTGQKPVFCSNCFEKNGDSRGPRRDPRPSFGGAPRGQDYSREFKTINEKLDRILEAMGEI